MLLIRGEQVPGCKTIISLSLRCEHARGASSLGFRPFGPPLAVTRLLTSSVCWSVVGSFETLLFYVVEKPTDSRFLLGSISSSTPTPGIRIVRFCQSEQTCPLMDMGFVVVGVGSPSQRNSAARREGCVSSTSYREHRTGRNGTTRSRQVRRPLSARSAQVRDPGSRYQLKFCPTAIDISAW